MKLDKPASLALGSTTLFVLLWSGGAIFAKWGLAHASAFAFLTLRLALALALISLLAWRRQRWLPAPGTRMRVAGTGVLLIGGYQIGYLLALAHGMTPGALATVLGVQPIATHMLVEPRASIRRVAGLGLAMGGLVVVVYHSLALAHFSTAGVVAALAALACMTAGAILQKGSSQMPMDVLPLQYGVSLVLCALFLPFEPLDVEFSAGLLLPLAYMGVVISVVATLLLYRLIRTGNLVNVTSLFYLVPVVTAALDYVFFGDTLGALSVGGMAAILLGLMLVFRDGHA
jgi:drug/metabolite transporter (DMT)-like permease